MDIGYKTMNDAERIQLLERLFVEVLANVQEDFPVDQWSRHLEDAMKDAYDYFSGEKK
jgi:hypothetical protein